MIIRTGGLYLKEERLLTMRYCYGHRDRFNLPGGNQEVGEDARSGLAREFREELKTEAEIGDLRWVVETSVQGREVLHLLFEIRSLTTPPQIDPAQTKALELVWLDITDLVKVSLYPGVGPVLAYWLSSGKAMSPYLGRVEQEWI